MTMTAFELTIGDIDPAILDEAADWLVMLQCNEFGEHERAALAGWRARSPSHEAAWRRAESMLDTFRRVPPGLGRNALARARNPQRREAMRKLALVLLAAPALSYLGWRELPWQAWSADLRTATGERRRLALADGTELVLNTASAVNLAFTAGERRLSLLQGEILVTTAADAARPFVVATAQGLLRPLGTRFAVRDFDDSVRVAVFAGAVEVSAAASAASAIVNAGAALRFNANALDAVQTVDASAALWESGMLLARDMRLGELVNELARYQRGLLRCDPDVANLLVSGAFPLDDIPASLALLERTLPLRIGGATPWWITVQAQKQETRS